MPRAKAVTIGVPHWTHKGQTNAILKSIHTTWHLVFPDGYQLDTRYASTGRDRFTREQMTIWVETGRSHR